MATKPFSVIMLTVILTGGTFIYCELNYCFFILYWKWNFVTDIVGFYQHHRYPGCLNEKQITFLQLKFWRQLLSINQVFFLKNLIILNLVAGNIFIYARLALFGYLIGVIWNDHGWSFPSKALIIIESFAISQQRIKIESYLKQRQNKNISLTNASNQGGIDKIMCSYWTNHSTHIILYDNTFSKILLFGGSGWFYSSKKPAFSRS